MDAYVDITLQPDEDFPLYQLMDTLIAKLHRALVETGHQTIGVSFPDWRRGRRPTLGQLLRLHGSYAVLDSFMQRNWMKGLNDLAGVHGPQAVPPTERYVHVSRIRTKSAANLRKRLMKRHGLNEHEAQARIPDAAGDNVDLPFTSQQSASTGQRYRLYIDQMPSETAGEGGFNAHGLSVGSAVPMF